MSKRNTSTSTFGYSSRQGHDASEFYKRYPAPRISESQTVVVPYEVDQLYVADSRDMNQVKSSSVALVITSPPYLANKAYEQDTTKDHIPESYLEQLQILRAVFAECFRVLEDGGRIAVNVANLGRKPYRSYSGDVLRILQDDLGFLPMGEIIWIKGKGANNSAAWGSWRSPTAPTLRDVTERILICAKGSFKRALHPAKRAEQGLPHEATISREDFMRCTLDVWEFPPASAKAVGHPAPFPVELPRRLIELHTFEGDLVLDPFMGSGSTALAARRTGRHYLGYDTDPTFVELARDRLRRDAEQP